MAKQKSRDIAFLPGYRWVYKGEEHWETSQGRDSVERHAIDPDGRRISVREAQALQRYAREVAGQPKAPTIPRAGRTKRIIGNNIPGDNTRTGQAGTIHNPERHGRTESWVFRSLVDAENYVFGQGVPDWAKYAIIQVRYTERLVTTNKTGSDVRDKNGYASLNTFFYDPEDLDKYAGSRDPGTTVVPNPWVQAYDNIRNYDMSGSRARVYLFFQEK